jgi:TRAP-type C4-dicarboxylate transport system substrate-binding protein
MNIRLTRRTALLGALALPAAARAQGAVRLTLGHGAAPGNPRSLAAERMANALRERSGGRIELRVAGSAQLGDDAAMVTALRTGTLDISVNSQGATSSVLPELAALGLPFLFGSPAAAYRVVDGGAAFPPPTATCCAPLRRKPAPTSASCRWPQTPACWASSRATARSASTA